MKNLSKEHSRQKKIIIAMVQIFVIYAFFFLSTVDSFFHKRNLEAKEVKTILDTKHLPPQPTLVTGGIESLTALVETNYLDRKPVLLFSDANTAKNPSSLINFSNSVVFHKEGFVDLALELFPETGTVTTSTPLKQNKKYRFTMRGKPLSLDILQDDNYKVFAKFKKEISDFAIANLYNKASTPSSNLAIVTVDTKELMPSTDIPFSQEDMTHWQCFANTYLNKGRHVITANPSIEELIIVPQDVFQNYIECTKNILQKKQVSYLFTNDKKGEPSVESNAANTKITSFVIANPGKYQLWAHVSPMDEKISFCNIGLKLSGVDLMSDAEIIKDTTGNEAAIFPFSQYNLDMEEYPHLKVEYNLADAIRNSLGFLLELDTDDDDIVDTLCYAGNIRYDLKPFLKIDMTSINLKKKDFWYKINRELGRSKDTDAHQWYYDAQGSGFSRNIEGNTLAVSSDFSKSTYFVIAKNFKPVNIKENQIVTLEYKMDNPNTQKLKINFRIDSDGNGRPDRVIETDYGGNPLITMDGYLRQEINVLTHSGINPNDEKSVCNLVEVILLCSGAGRFYLKEFSIGKQQIVAPDEIRKYLSEREDILNKKKEEENSWVQNWRKKGMIPLNTIVLYGEEKREKGMTVLTVNNIFQQIQNTLYNTYYCKLKGLIPILYRKKKLPGTVSLWKDNLKEVLQKLEFFDYETLEVPKFIAETKTKKEWEKKFEEETLRYGVEKAVYRKDWGRERCDAEDYAMDEWFGIDNIKDAMTAHSEINHWEIKGVNSTFILTRFLDGIEMAFYLDGGEEEDEKVIFSPKTMDFQGLGIKEGISFDISYELSDSNRTELVLCLGVDFDGDKKEDATFKLTPSSIEDKTITGRKIKVAHFDTTQVLEFYPEKEKLNLSSFLLSVEKKQGLNFIGTERTVKKAFLNEVKIKKKRRDQEDGAQLVVYTDKEGKPLLISLPDTETIHTLNFSAQVPLEYSTFLKNGWEYSAKNTSCRLSYSKEGLNIQGLFYRSGQERYLILKKYLNGINLQKYPYMRFPFQVVVSDSLDFSVDEFKNNFTIDALCTAINKDEYGITFKESDNTIKRLNELLRVSNFYDIWSKKDKPLNLTEYAYKLISETREYRNMCFSELSEVQQKNILKLNRFIIETTYSQTCPSNLDRIDVNKENLWVEFRGKCSPRRNFILKLGGSTFKDNQGYHVNLLKELKKIYPDSSDFVLDDIAVSIDPTVGKFDERLLSYSSDTWTSDKETQIFIKSLQFFGIKENDIESMLKKKIVREIETPQRVVVNDITWTSEAIANTEFQHKTFGDEQYIRTYFRQDGLKEEGTMLNAVFKQLHGLSHIQTIDFDYSLENPNVQGIVIVPEFDNNYRSSPISFLNLAEKAGHLSYNIEEKIKDIYKKNENTSAKLTSLLFFLVKRPGISCKENDLTNAYTFSIKNINFTAAPLTTIYEQLLSQLIMGFNGKRYIFGDGFKVKNGSIKLNKEAKEVNETPIIGQEQTMSQFVSSGRMPFYLGNVEVTDEDCKINIYPPSKYLKVEAVEIIKPIPVDFKEGQNPLQNTNGSEPGIIFKKINPTRYVVDVKADKPFWLVFSESFHSGWKAYVRRETEGRSLKSEKYKNTEHWSALISAWKNKGKRVELTEHQMVNGYANGWYVPVGQKSEAGSQKPEVRSQKSEEEEEEKLTGDFQIVLEYKPQLLFEIGILISGVTFISCIGYLGWGGIRGLIPKRN